MPVESSAVQITINVVDGNSGEVINGVVRSFDKLGTAGTRAGKQAADGMKEVGVGAMSSVEKARLVEESFGIRLPRAFTRLASESKVLSGTIGALGGVMAGIAGIEMGYMVFDQMYQGAKKFYEQYLDVNKAVDEYMRKAGEAADKKLFDTASIETATSLLKEANSEIDRLNEKRNQGPSLAEIIASSQAPGGPGYTTYRGEHYTQADDKQLAQAYEDRDAAWARQAEQAKQLQLKDVESQNELASSVARPWEKANVELENATRLAQRHLEVTQADEKALYAETVALRTRQDAENKIPVEQRVQVHQIDPNAGKAEYGQEIADAQRKAQAERVAYQRSSTQEILHLEDQARQASLRGIALLEDQRRSADRDWVAQHRNSVRAVAAIDQKYYADEAKMARDAANELRKAQEQTHLAGLTGIARTAQEGQNRLADFYSTDHPGMNPGQRLAMVHAITTQTQQSIAQEQQTFAQHVDQITQASVDRTVTGFARIHADAEKAIADLRREAQEKGGSQADLNRGIAGIRQGEAGQVAERQAHNREETEQFEAEAREKFLMAERNQTQAIIEQYNARTEKYFEELRAREIGEEDYNRRVVAAGQLRDAELVESQRQAREKMAGEFSSFFSEMQHPSQALAHLGDKMAGEAAASLVQRVQNHYGGQGGEHLGLPDTNIFDRIAGAPRASGSAEHAIAGAAGMKTIAVSQAMIQVGTASIAFGGVGGSAAGGAPAGFSGSGSAPPSYFVAGGAGNASSWTGGGATEWTGSSGAIGAGSTGGIGSPAFSGSAGTNNIAQGIQDAKQGYSLTRQMYGYFQSGGGGATGSGGANGGDLINFDDSNASGVVNEGYGSNGALTLGGTGSDGGGLVNEGYGSNGALTLGGVDSGGGGGNGSMMSSGMSMQNAGGAAGGAMGMYGAYESNGGASGAMQGAASGAQFGASVGGPVGAVIGGIAGAILGWRGEGGRDKAQEYNFKEVRPHIDQTLKSVEQGENYLTAYNDLQSLDVTAQQTVKQWGHGGQTYYNDRIKPEIAQARGKVDQLGRAGRQNYGESQAQYATGIDFVPRTEMALVHQGERIFDTDSNRTITRAFQNLASPQRMPIQGSGGGDTHFHIHALDTQTGVEWLMAQKHVIRAANNASYAENSGGADAGF